MDGPLFKGRYKAILVNEGNYLLELVRYIHRNPLKAGLVDDLAAYPYTSHKAYMSQARKWDWVDKERILSLFSEELSLARKTYKRFVYQEDSEEIAKIFASGRLPAFIGSKKFVAWVKETFGPGKSDPEVPGSAVLRPDSDAIILAVCNAYGEDAAALKKVRRGYFNESRSVAIFLMRMLTNQTLKNIGKFFSLSHYSSVSSAAAGMKTRMEKDRKLHKRVDDLRNDLLKGQIKT